MSFSSRYLQYALAGALAVTSAYSVMAVAQEASSSGEVRRVNPDEGKVTIRHGAIADLQLPAMTLVYRSNPDLLKDLQPGDKITFTAKREGDKYVVTQIKK